MDVAVYEDRICRIFFGKEVLYLRWSDIKVIKDVVRKSMSGQPVRSFYVIPCNGVSMILWSGGWIRFTDSMRNFHTFVDVMNKQIQSHGVRVERIRGVDIVMCDEISKGRGDI